MPPLFPFPSPVSCFSIDFSSPSLGDSSLTRRSAIVVSNTIFPSTQSASSSPSFMLPCASIFFQKLTSTPVTVSFDVYRVFYLRLQQATSGDKRSYFYRCSRSRCHQDLQSRSLLRKFIESLAFSARLWVLLAVSSFMKTFAGVLSEMEILGLKHMEGLVQKYSSSCLPLSHGVVTEYWQHELCGCGKETDYNPPKLVVPISNLISHYEDTFIKKLHADSDINNHQYSSLVCGGKSHDQPIRSILKSEDMNIVLLGTLKISERSGRLQLVDATGSIDSLC
ncbi:hypothetical protein LXL04_007426 [Taraxacum kok-saghyz]